MEPVVSRSQMKWAKATPTKCLYCGGSTWWPECACTRASEVRAGKRAKPKIIFRGGRMIVVLDPEAAANNALGLPVYEPMVVQIASPQAIQTEEEAQAAVAKPDRKEYMRELMRKKRAAAKAAKGGENA